MPRSRARTQHQQRHEPTPIVSDDQSLLDAVEGLPEDDFEGGNVEVDEDLETDHELEGEEGAGAFDPTLQSRPHRNVGT
ncbi:hypothetical protein BDZ91DRAFT_721561 [Kalaharituber pfeilii]|nr:hypothetical protein BDZ91DRAFT_721561 [Kalaharituber pfeilii]